ncbi:hypothetical protein REPUB_Repub02eG0166800 [Reevesia pubescens]
MVTEVVPTFFLGLKSRDSSLGFAKTRVKFDPSDAKLLEYLAAKCGVGNSKAHLLIDEFIHTLEEDQGICYTYPENLPGAKKDGSSIHFFHRIINAHATG